MLEWAAASEDQQNDHIFNEDSDQPGHQRRRWSARGSICPVWSETSSWAVLVAKGPILLHADSEDWSDWADAQADLSLRWARRSYCWFCHAPAQSELWKEGRTSRWTVPTAVNILVRCFIPVWKRLLQLLLRFLHSSETKTNDALWATFKLMLNEHCYVKM